ncbi:MAG: TolC family protein [Flavobacteriales bacterium]|nr:TolC family protein [Flavobacteriales bacterium]
MYIFKVIAFCASFLSLGLYAQVSSIEGILKEVEQNNTELKSVALYFESEKLRLKAGNNLEDPQLGAFYLPLGEYTGPAYTEFQVSQTFDFPTVYGARNKLIQQNALGLDMAFRQKRQEILLQTQEQCIELIHLNKRLAIESKRIAESKKAFEHNTARYEKNQVGIMDLNRAKINWLQVQFRADQLKKERNNALVVLKTLNGGKPIELGATDFTDLPAVPAKDSLWKAKLATDPQLEQLKQEQLMAEQQLKLSRNNALPKITAGFNYQGNSVQNNSGLYAGLSIPIWSNRHKVNAARLNMEFRETALTFQTELAYSEFEKQYAEYEILLNEFTEYKKAFNALNSEHLLTKSYELGEISFLEYHREFTFYREALDVYLNIEKRLYQVRSQLLKHQL